MEQIIPLILAKLLEHGAWGILIILLGYANWRQDQTIKRMVGSQQEAAKALDTIQERRADERARNAEVMAGQSASLIRLSDAVKELANEVREDSCRYDADARRRR